MFWYAGVTRATLETYMYMYMYMQLYLVTCTCRKHSKLYVKGNIVQVNLANTNAVLQWRVYNDIFHNQSTISNNHISCYKKITIFLVSILIDKYYTLTLIRDAESAMYACTCTCTVYLLYSVHHHSFLSLIKIVPV